MMVEVGVVITEVESVAGASLIAPKQIHVPAAKWIFRLLNVTMPARE